MAKRNAKRKSDGGRGIKRGVWLTLVLAILLVMVAVARCTPHRSGAARLTVRPLGLDRRGDVLVCTYVGSAFAVKFTYLSLVCSAAARW